MPTLLTLPVRSKRDALFARQWARQIAGLLHFDIPEQACIAAGAFVIASEALRRSRSSRLCVGIENSILQIAPLACLKGRSPRGKTLRLVKALSADAPPLAVEDLAWLIKKINGRVKHNAFAEIERQNQEVLALVHALRHAPVGFGVPDPAACHLWTPIQAAG